MAEDVVIQGGLFDLTIRKALSEADDAVTGDKANIMNMALARGCWFQWEYTVQIGLHTEEVEADLAELGEMRDLYAEVADWTPQMLQAPTNLADSLNELLRWGAGSKLTDQASSATITVAAGTTFDWPPQTSLVIPLPTPGPPVVRPIGTWQSVLDGLPAYDADTIYRTTDGVYFRGAPGGTGAPVRVEPQDIQLTFDNAPLLGGDTEIAQARRELEAAIESKTQRNQEKQAQLQDITAMLQKWFNFTTNLNERKKRDADGIVGNFH